MAGLVSAALVLAGCSDDVLGPDLPELAHAQLSPEGDGGQWFHDGYAEGVIGTFTTTDEVCGVAEETVIEVTAPTTGDQRVRAWNLDSGAIGWEIQGASCSAGSVLDGTIAIGGGENGEGWRLHDVRTGELRSDLNLDEDASQIQQLTQTEDTLVLLLDREVLVGVDADGVRWRESGHLSSEVAVLGDGHLGITNGLEDWVTILDAGTGEPTLPRRSHDPQDLEWASDGYTLRINQSDPEYAFFDVDGNEVDRTVGESQFGFRPAPRHGITFPISDHREAGTVHAVDATGVPTLFSSDTGHGFYTQEGRVEDPSESAAFLRASSEDGSLHLFPRFGEGFVIRDTRGEAVLDWPVPTESVWVESGYIAFNDDFSTQILIPED